MVRPKADRGEVYREMAGTIVLLPERTRLRIMGEMTALTSRPTDVDIESGPRGMSRPAGPQASDSLARAQERLAQARERLLEAAIAFCDGQISAGQLKAVRELLREREREVARLLGPRQQPPPPRPAAKGSEAEQPPDRTRPLGRPQAPESPPKGSPTDRPEPASTDLPEELRQRLAVLDQKLARLEQARRAGQVNRAQYEAIRKHYLEQREVALRLHARNPQSDRWRVVLEPGKTTFLMKLHEATCLCVAIYDMRTQEQLHIEGRPPSALEEAVAFLRAFSRRASNAAPGKIYATRAESGETLLFIPGLHTAALVAFEGEPPNWQVAALHELHRNFEAVNRAALEAGKRQGLVLPNLTRFVKH